jgi:hypothetical protein
MRTVTRGTPEQKKNSSDVPVVVSDEDYDTEPEEDDYMITVDKWKNFPKAQRRMVKGLIAKENFMWAMTYRRTGMTISATVPKDFEIEQAKQFTVMSERTKGKVVAPLELRLQWLAIPRKTKTETTLDTDHKEKT